MYQLLDFAFYTKIRLWPYGLQVFHLDSLEYDPDQ